MVVFPYLNYDLWSQKSLSSLSSTLRTPIGAQRLGKSDYRPSTLVGMIVSRDFAFLEELVLKVVDTKAVR